MNIKFLAQGNNGLPLAGFEPTRSAILRRFLITVTKAIIEVTQRKTVELMLCMNKIIKMK
jgi:hypothetical protein